MFQVLFFLGIHGVVFHAIFLLVSLMLIGGAIKAVPPLLLPWLCFAPFIFLAIIVNVVLVVERQLEVAGPTISFAIIIAILLIYSTYIISSHYKEICRMEGQRILDALHGRRYNRIHPLQRFAAFFRGFGQYSTEPVMTQVSSQQPTPVSSSPPQSAPSPDREEMRSVLSRTYARMLMASQPTHVHGTSS